MRELFITAVKKGTQLSSQHQEKWHGKTWLDLKQKRRTKRMLLNLVKA